MFKVLGALFVVVQAIAIGVAFFRNADHVLSSRCPRCGIERRSQQMELGRTWFGKRRIKCRNCSKIYKVQDRPWWRVGPFR